MQVVTSSYAIKGGERWSYSLESGRAAKRYVLSSASGFRCKSDAKAAGDALVASLMARAMVKRAQQARAWK